MVYTKCIDHNWRDIFASNTWEKLRGCNTDLRRLPWLVPGFYLHRLEVAGVKGKTVKILGNIYERLIDNNESMGMKLK